MSDMGLQSFINGLRWSRDRLHREGRVGRGVADWSYSWTNVPTPVRYIPPTNQELLTRSPNLQEKMNELWVGLFRYRHIIKRLRELFAIKIRRRRYLTFAESWWAPPRSAAGGRRGGRGYIDTREHYNYNQGNNMVTRHQKRKWDDTAWYDRKWGDGPYE